MRRDNPSLYEPAVSAFWKAQVGMRYDIEPRPQRGFAVIGLEGVAPYWAAIETAPFVSGDGNVSARGRPNTTCC